MRILIYLIVLNFNIVKAETNFIDSNNKTAINFTNKINMNHQLRHFVLVNRGGCRLVDKARNVQVSGGIGIVVINSKNKPLIHMPRGELGTDDIEIGVGMVHNEMGVWLNDYIQSCMNMEDTKAKVKKNTEESIRDAILKSIISSINLFSF